MKEESLPPIGTKVFDIQFGWGEIKSIDEGEVYSINAYFQNKGNPIGYSYTSKGKSKIGDVTTLSLTEYDLVKGGFTPITEWDKPKPGDVGYFWDDDDDYYLKFGVITEISDGEYPYSINNKSGWKNFSKEVPEWYTKKL